MQSRAGVEYKLIYYDISARSQIFSWGGPETSHIGWERPHSPLVEEFSNNYCSLLPKYLLLRTSQFRENHGTPLSKIPGSAPEE